MVSRIVRKTSQLEHANAGLEEFSYRLSHDLRAPVVSALGLVLESDQSKACAQP